MLGLPPTTAALLLGFPLLWVIYTLVFLWLTRDWPRREREEA